MSNTYAINTTRGKEFDVEAELVSLGLHPWVPRRLEEKYVKEKGQSVWYDRPYVAKLIFCVIPAVYWRDVVELKHVIGKPSAISERDVKRPQDAPKQRGFLTKPKPHEDQLVTDANGNPIPIPIKSTLEDFRNAVQAEYQDMQSRKEDNDYQCTFEPGQALELLDDVFADHDAKFLEVIRDAKTKRAKLRVEMQMMGSTVKVDVDRNRVRART